MEFVDILRQHWNWKAAVEILLLAAVIYLLFLVIRRTRGVVIVRGIALVLVLVFFVVLFLAQWLHLPVIRALMSQLVSIGAIAMFIIFQPELRRGLVRLGQNPLLGLFAKSETALRIEIIEAAVALANNKIGAIIVIVQDTGLASFIEAGTTIDAEVNSALIQTIFHPGTPLHDGGIIVEEDRIAAAGCVFPLTENPEARYLGTRHRAGVGVTEESDAIAIIVSEERGEISVAHRGELQVGLDRDKLRRVLETHSAGRSLPSATEA